MVVDTSQFNFTNTFVALEIFEKGLNIAGYIPVVGSVSSFIRRSYGTVEMIAGIALAIFSLALKSQGDLAISSLYLTVGLTLMGHSILNFIRAIPESIPLVALFTTLPYDLYATYVVGRRLFPYIQ